MSFPDRSDAVQVIQAVVSAIASGVLSAFLFIGVGGRVAMWLLSIWLQRRVDFSFEGTVAVLVFSTSIGIIGGILFPAVRKFIPGSHTAKGGYFGLLLFVVLIPMLPSSVQQEALGLGDSIPLIITLFGLLLMGYGVSLEFLERKLNSISQIRPPRVFVQ